MLRHIFISAIFLTKVCFAEPTHKQEIIKPSPNEGTPSIGTANIKPNFCEPASEDQVIDILKNLRGATTTERLIEVSGAQGIMGKPFGAAPCGEGPNAKFCQAPITSFEKFDCVTFLEATLALAKVNKSTPASKQFEEYMKHLKDIKYCDSEKICLENRNHFVEVDWLPNAQKKKYIADITKTIYSDAPTQQKLISKKKWYAGKSDTEIQVDGLTDAERAERLQELRALGEKIPDQQSTLAYIPLENLLSKDVQNKFPDISVFSMVKAEHTKVSIPTMVGHQGLIVRKQDGNLYLRHAAIKEQVKDVLLEDYVQLRMKDTTWPTLGFNIQKPL